MRAAADGGLAMHRRELVQVPERDDGAVSDGRTLAVVVCRIQRVGAHVTLHGSGEERDDQNHGAWLKSPVGSDYPAVWVHSVGHGHHAIFRCLHRLGMITRWPSLCDLIQPDREVRHERELRTRAPVPRAPCPVPRQKPRSWAAIQGFQLRPCRALITASRSYRSCGGRQWPPPEAAGSFLGLSISACHGAHPAPTVVLLAGDSLGRHIPGAITSRSWRIGGFVRLRWRTSRW
jgi:hypothetical protein